MTMHRNTLHMTQRSIQGGAGPHSIRCIGNPSESVYRVTHMDLWRRGNACGSRYTRRSSVLSFLHPIDTNMASLVLHCGRAVVYKQYSNFQNKGGTKSQYWMAHSSTLSPSRRPPPSPFFLNPHSTRRTTNNFQRHSWHHSARE